jgi:hypothetical protein
VAVEDFKMLGQVPDVDERHGYDPFCNMGPDILSRYSGTLRIFGGGFFLPPMKDLRGWNGAIVQ